MDSSNITATTTNNTTGSNYQEIPFSSFLNLPQPPPPPPPPPSSSSPSPSPSPSFFDPLPSYIPTFHQEPSSSSSQPPPRSNKKRSRASRRAPTTVLTTDTSNFRAMVQEFTGFPAPPFSASSLPHPRPPRFDHLSASPYLLSRPFTHKLPTPSSLPVAIAANAAAYPFADAATIIGIQDQNTILAPPHPHFGDHLASFAAADHSEGMHAQPTWADHDPQHPDDHFHRQDKRQKTSGGGSVGGVVESWLHSSD